MQFLINRKQLYRFYFTSHLYLLSQYNFSTGEKVTCTTKGCSFAWRRHPARLWWINITVPEKRGRTFLKKQGRKLKIQGTNFKICQTYFLPKKEACVSISYKGLFFAPFWIKSGNVPHDYAMQTWEHRILFVVFPREACYYSQRKSASPERPAD